MCRRTQTALAANLERFGAVICSRLLTVRRGHKVTLIQSGALSGSRIGADLDSKWNPIDASADFAHFRS